VEDAAADLRGQVDAVLAGEKAKEVAIREAVKQLDSNGEEIKKSVVVLSAELEATRQALIQEVNTWCESHLHRLEGVGERKQTNLEAQEEKLRTMADMLASHQKNTLGALKDSKGLSELIPLCLRLLDKVR